MYSELALLYKAMHVVDEVTDEAISGAVDAAVKKVLGESMGAAWNKAKAFIAEKTEGFPGNHDLQMALRLCMLTATDMVRKSMKENKEDEKFREILLKWIAEQSTEKSLKKLSVWTHYPNEAVHQLDLLMTNNEPFAQKKAELSKQMTRQWHEQLKDALQHTWSQPIPETFTDKLFNGFEYDGSRFEWHLAVYVLFAEMMRNGKTELGKRADKAFNQTFLADISQKLDEQALDHADIKLDLIRIKGQLTLPGALHISDIPGWEKLIAFKDELGLMAKAVTDLSETVLSQQRTIESQQVEKEYDAELRIILFQQLRKKDERITELSNQFIESLKQGRIDQKRNAELEHLIKEKDELIANHPSLLLKEYEALRERQTAEENYNLLCKAELFADTLKSQVKEKKAIAAFELAQSKLSNHDFMNAIKFMKEANELDPEEARFVIGLSRIYYEIGLYDKAWHELKPLFEKSDTMDLETTKMFLNQAGVTQMVFRQYDTAKVFFDKWIELHRDQHGPIAIHGADVILGNLSHIHEEQGNFDQALINYDIILDTNVRVYGKRAYPTIRTWLAIGNHHTKRGNFISATRILRYVKRVFELKNATNNMDFASVLNNLAGALRDNGRYDLALNEITRAILTIVNIYGKDSPRLRESVQLKASILFDTGKLSEALAEYQIAYEIIVGPDVPQEELANDMMRPAKKIQAALRRDFIHCSIKITECLMYLSRFEECNNYLDFAHNVCFYGGDKDSFEFGNILGLMARVHHEAGELDLEMDKCQKAIEVFEALLANNPNDRKVGIYLSSACNNISSCYYERNDIEQTIRFQQRDIDLQEMFTDCSNEHYIVSLNDLAVYYRRLSILDKAVLYYNKALPLSIEVLGETHPTSEVIRNGLQLTQDLVAHGKT